MRIKRTKPAKGADVNHRHSTLVHPVRRKFEAYLRMCIDFYVRHKTSRPLVEDPLARCVIFTEIFKHPLYFK